MHGYPNSEQVTEVEPGIVSFSSETTQLRHAKRSTKRELFTSLILTIRHCEFFVLTTNIQSEKLLLNQPEAIKHLRRSL